MAQRIMTPILILRNARIIGHRREVVAIQGQIDRSRFGVVQASPLAPRLRRPKRRAHRQESNAVGRRATSSQAMQSTEQGIGGQNLGEVLSKALSPGRSTASSKLKIVARIGGVDASSGKPMVCPRKNEH